MDTGMKTGTHNLGAEHDRLIFAKIEEDGSLLLRDVSTPDTQIKLGSKHVAALLELLA
tara:strand:+ start:950 stop:1123 length:174 start_codon:yes stop_codon:yes gene_type:complete